MPPRNRTVVIGVGIVGAQTNGVGKIDGRIGETLHPQVYVTSRVIRRGALRIQFDSPVEGPQSIPELVPGGLIPSKVVVIARVRFWGNGLSRRRTFRFANRAKPAEGGHGGRLHGAGVIGLRPIRRDLRFFRIQRFDPEVTAALRPAINANFPHGARSTQYSVPAALAGKREHTWFM